jgi:uncharacterized protein YjbI with pentapeptide repeats
MPRVYHLVTEAERRLRHVEGSLRRFSLLRILEHLGKLTILFAIVFYFLEADQRRLARHAQAWQVIDAASNGGKIPFIEALARDGGSLAGLNMQGMLGDHIELSSADLRGAILDDAVFVQSNLQASNLSSASLAKANLRDCTLSQAKLMRADLRGAKLWNANLAGADLTDADLRGAELFGAILQGANLCRVKVDEGTNLAGCDLTRAALCGIDLRAANLKGATIHESLCFMVVMTREQAESVRGKNGILLGSAYAPQARRLMMTGIINPGASRSQRLIGLDDHKLCYDPLLVREMALTTLASQNQRRERVGIHVVERDTDTALTRSLHKANEQYFRERQRLAKNAFSDAARSR